MLRFRNISHESLFRQSGDEGSLRVTRNDTTDFHNICKTFSHAPQPVASQNIRIDNNGRLNLDPLASVSRDARAICALSESLKSGAVSSSFGFVGGTLGSCLLGAGVLGPIAWIGAAVVGCGVGTLQYVAATKALARDRLMDELIEVARLSVGNPQAFDAETRHQFEDLRRRSESDAPGCFVVYNRIREALERQGSL